MTIRIIIEGYLKHYTDNIGLVHAKGNSISNCLDDLIQQYPDFKKRLIDENGNLRLIVNYKGKFISLRKDLSQAVKDGDKFHILPLIGGG